MLLEAAIAAVFAAAAAAGLYGPASRRLQLQTSATSRAVSAATSALLAATGAAVTGVRPAVAGYVVLAVATPLLTRADLQRHRLPEVLTMPCAGVGLLAFALDAAITGDVHRLERSVVAAAALWLAYFVIRHLSKRSLGRGDLTLAAVLGLHLGWLSWAATSLGAFAAFTLPALVLLPALLVRRLGRRTRVPFGPHMLTGAFLVLIAAGLTHLHRTSPTRLSPGIEGLTPTSTAALLVTALAVTALLTRAGRTRPTTVAAGPALTSTST